MPRKTLEACDLIFEYKTILTFKIVVLYAGDLQCLWFVLPALTRLVTSHAFAVHYCSCAACPCYPAGSLAHLCHKSGPMSGQCECKANVEGVACTTCQSGYYSLDASNPDGCQGTSATKWMKSQALLVLLFVTRVIHFKDSPYGFYLIFHEDTNLHARSPRYSHGLCACGKVPFPLN